MALIHRIVRGISDLGMVLSVTIMIAMFVLVVAEIVARNVFSTSTFVMNELVGYGVAAMTMLALGHSLERGTVIRMSLLLVSLQQDSLIRRLLEIIAVLLGLLAAGIALRYFLHSAIRSYERAYVSETAAQIPLWIPEAFVIVGLGILMLQLVSYLIRLLAGQPAITGQVDSMAGSNDTPRQER